MSIVYPFPTLHEHTLDYKNPDAYTAVFRRDDDTMVSVNHCLFHDSLIGSLVAEERATFFCTLSIRGTAIRSTDVVNSSDIKLIHSNLEVRQTVEIPKFPWSPELFATSGVMLLEELLVSDLAGTDLIEFFHDRGTISFPAYAKVAFKDWVRFYSMGTLFTIRSDVSIPKGAFKVDVLSSSTLEIYITLHPMDREVVCADRNGSTRKHVLCSALTQAFQEILQFQKIADEPDSTEGKDEALQFLELTESLQRFLEARCIPTWVEDDFNPALSASLLYQAVSAEADDATDLEE